MASHTMSMSSSGGHSAQLPGNASGAKSRWARTKVRSAPSAMSEIFFSKAATVDGVIGCTVPLRASYTCCAGDKKHTRIGNRGSEAGASE